MLKQNRTLKVIIEKQKLSVLLLQKAKMENKYKVEIIPAKSKQRDKKVAIYARVSSNSSEQLKSLQAHVFGLTRLAAVKPNWLLVDIYMDIETSKTGSNRKEFHGLVDDCGKGKIDILITKSISRFGRDTIEVLNALDELTKSDTRIIFINEGIDSLKDDARLYITVHTAVERKKMNLEVQIYDGVFFDR